VNVADRGSPPAAPHREHTTTALPLLGAWTLLVVYASLFPFEGWLWPQALPSPRVLALPWPAWRDRFDDAANLLGYLPFGMLACAASLRRGRSPARAIAGAVAAAALLSYGVEVLQSFLPTRVPSLKDTAFNVTGAAIGAAAAAVLVAAGVIEPWRRLRERWFDRRSGFALTLLMLWPVALLYPAPVPLGLGHVWGELTNLAADIVAGTPLAERFDAWIESLQQPVGQLSTEHELAIVALGLVGPCLMAYALTSFPRMRLALAAGALLLALCVTTLSIALSFGPDHALAWFTPGVLGGLAAGAAVAVACIALPIRAAAGAASVGLALLIAAVASAPPDPFYASFLSTWEQGRFVRFHGVAQWVARVWPFLALAWLLPRALAGRRAGARSEK
jgi:VanZ family protein